MGDNDFATGYALGSDGNNNNDMFGGGGWWAIILFAMIFGWGRGGWGNNNSGDAGYQGAVTRSDLCSEFNFNNLSRSVLGIQNGICDGFYAMNTGLLNGFNNTNTAMMQGFNASTIAAMQNQNALSTQLANCCCENRQGQADIKYAMATDTCALQNTMNTNTRDIIDNQNANTRSILDYLCQNQISDLKDKLAAAQLENQNLKFAASQEVQNNYLVNALRPAPVPAFNVPAPYQYSGCGNSCC